MDRASIPRKGDTVLSRGDGVERDKNRAENRASMAKSDGEKGGSKIPRLAHRPPRSHRPSSVASSSSTDTDHSAVKEELAKLTKPANKLHSALLLNAACLVAVNAATHDGKHSPVFTATDSAMQLLSLRRKNRTKSDSCVTSARQGRKGHSRVKSDTSAIRTSKRRKTPRAATDGSSDLSSTSSDSSKFGVHRHVPSGSAISDSLEVSDHALKKCRSSIGKDGDDEDTDDSTVIESPPSFLELKNSLNSDTSKVKTEKRIDKEAVIINAVVADVLVHEHKFAASEVCELEQISPLCATNDKTNVTTNTTMRKAKSQDKVIINNLKRSFSSVETNTRSAQSSNCNVESAESSEDYHSCRSFCSIDPGICPSMCTMQDIGKAARCELKMAGNLQAMTPGEHRLRSMQLQSRIADMIKLGRSWLQTPSKGKGARNGKRCKGNLTELEENGMKCRLSKSQSSVIGINPSLFDCSQKPNPLPRTIYFCKKNETDGNRTATSDASSENSYEDWYESSGRNASRGEELSLGEAACGLVSTSFVDGPEIIPKEKLTKQELEQHCLQFDEVDRNTVGIQVNLYSILEFQTRFGVDIGVQVDYNDLELENFALLHDCEHSASTITLKPKRSRLPICSKAKFTYDDNASVNAGNSSTTLLNVDGNYVNSSVPKIDLSVLTHKESRTTQISFNSNGPKTSQISLGKKHSRTTQVPLEYNGIQTNEAFTEEVSCIPVELSLYENVDDGVYTDNAKDEIHSPRAKSKESLLQKGVEVNIDQVEVEEFSPKCRVLQETNAKPVEIINLQSEIKVESSSKANASFRTCKKPSPKVSPKISPKVATKQSPKPLTRFTYLKKSNKQDPSVKTCGPNTQANKSDHAVMAKKDSTPNTAKSDQEVKGSSQTLSFVKKTPKIPRRIPILSKDKAGTIKEKILANCTNCTRLTAGIDDTDTKTMAPSSASSTRSIIEVGKNELSNKPENSVHQQKDKNSRIPRQDVVGGPKPRLPGSSRDIRCLASRSTTLECSHTGKFRSSANSKTTKKKPFSAM